MTTYSNFYMNDTQVLQISKESNDRAEGLVPTAEHEKMVDGAIRVFDRLQDEGFEPDEILGFILQSIIREIGPISD